MKIFALLCALWLGALPAVAQDDTPDGIAPPEAVELDALPSGALFWTRLPAIQFDRAVLRTEDGRAVVMTVRSRAGGFVQMRLDDASGLGWASYVGPQKFSQIGALGDRIAIRVEGPEWLNVPANAGGPIDGVAPRDLATKLTLAFDDGSRQTIQREVTGVGEADVVVNGAPSTVDAIVLKVTVTSGGGGPPLVSQAVYAPALGAAVRGVFLEPRRLAWRLDDIKTSADVAARLRPAGAGPGATR